jgi:5-methylcytosine-specific restriction endonuclease McrA
MTAPEVPETEVWKGSRKQREALRQKFGGRCAYCGCDLSGGLHCDHMEPVIRYTPSVWDPSAPKGVQMVKPERNTVSNMMPACKACNLHKGGYSLESWRTYLQRSAEIVRKQTSTFRAGERFGVITVSDAPIVFYFERQAASQSAGGDA